MKKLSLILSAVLLLGALALTACTGSADTGKETEAGTTAATTPETTPATESETVAETESTKITYTVTVKDQDGNPVVGARVMMCQDELCMNPVKTNDSGVATFQLDEATYRAKLAVLPEGYTGDMENYIDFPAGSNDLTITVTKG